MKQIKILSAIAVLIFISGLNFSIAQTGSKTIYYFYAENCSACKQAEAHFNKPAGIKDGESWRHGLNTFVPYRIVDSSNKIQTQNMKRLTDMCDGLAKRLGTNEFVYFRREKYQYYKKNNLPYYKKDDKYSRRDDAFPTPIFIIGDRVVLGFNLTLIQQSISLMK